MTSDETQRRYTDDVLLHAELKEKEQIKGRHPGNRNVRIVRPQSQGIARQEPGGFVAKERVLAQRGPIGHILEMLRRIPR